MAPALLQRVLVCTRGTVEEDALMAFGAGGVHAMHDATEGGVLTGILEIRHAAGIPVACNFDAVPVPEDIAEVARELGFDPWAAISDGPLLAAVAPEAVAGATAALAAKGIPGCLLVRFDARLAGDPATRGGVLVRGGVSQRLPELDEDPFWALFATG